VGSGVGPPADVVGTVGGTEGRSDMAGTVVGLCEEYQSVWWMAMTSVLILVRQVGLMFMLLSGETLERMVATDQAR
jgi:hypothetical protein